MPDPRRACRRSADPLPALSRSGDPAVLHPRNRYRAPRRPRAVAAWSPRCRAPAPGDAGAAVERSRPSGARSAGNAIADPRTSARSHGNLRAAWRMLGYRVGSAHPSLRLTMPLQSDPSRDEPVYFLLHIPKTAGQTIQVHLAEHCAPGVFWRSRGRLGWRAAPAPTICQISIVLASYLDSISDARSKRCSPAAQFAASCCCAIRSSCKSRSTIGR